MFKVLFKSFLRSVKKTLGRYIAILLIIALGVGFYTGVKDAKPTMVDMADKLYTASDMYDYQLRTNYGLTDGDVKTFDDLQMYGSAEGSLNKDMLAKVNDEKNKDIVLDVYSLPLKVAKPILKEGEDIKYIEEGTVKVKLDSCLGDESYFTKEDIGKTITITEPKKKNSDDADVLKSHEYILTGLVQSPRFLNKDRGKTSLLSGNISAFIYIARDNFVKETYDEIDYNCAIEGSKFDKSYSKQLDRYQNRLHRVLNERAEIRYNELFKEAIDGLNTINTTLDTLNKLRERLISSGIDQDQIDDLDEQIKKLEEQKKEVEDELSKYPTNKVYVLALSDSNQSYISFKGDVDIINSIAFVFPVFFVAIAALVCITTMSKLVTEERTEIGTMKALGYSNAVISLKYLAYSVTAALFGQLIGFFLGTIFVPKLAWTVYSINYTLGSTSYHFSLSSFLITLLIAVLGSAIITLGSCANQLKEKPADSMRPKASKPGKRLLFERVKPLWNKLSFLNKVTIRNAFKNKKKLAMFILGISGCTMLVLTGFGLYNSVANFGDQQYTEILKYDATATFDASVSDRNEISTLLDNSTKSYDFAYSESLTFTLGNGKYKDCTLVSIDESQAYKYFSLHNKKEMISYPTSDECVVTRKFSEKNSVDKGDKLSVTVGEKELTLKVKAICDNYVDHYIYISDDLIDNTLLNSIYINLNDVEDDSILSQLRSITGVAMVMSTKDIREVTDNSMSSVTYIVLFLILCSGILAFIVLYNITNINIMERTREIATVEVLGFRKKERNAYILRENIIFGVLSALIGLPFGVVMTYFVMQAVDTPNIYFDIRISWYSYLVAFTLSLVFTIISNLIMSRKLKKINMAESLKSVE